MSGKPAARQGDMTQYGGPIVQGSDRTKTPAPVGIFGPGWKAPSDIRLQIRDDALVLNDNGGRSIHFEPLLPGEAVYSRSESLWLVRGGKATQPDGHTLAR
ncbi:DUF6531 domain-containing protein, partial [Escherichia coli]|uniref:DUF6531 domain-containing protein n=1 Tax=Escherichia coli TaxID=562 RepID=UPI001F4B1B35